jgi:hypothetical protein
MKDQSNFIAFIIGATFFSIAIFGSLLYPPKATDPVNYSIYRAEGCKQIVDNLYQDGKLTSLYHSDALQECHDLYERDDE